MTPNFQPVSVGTYMIGVMDGPRGKPEGLLLECLKVCEVGRRKPSNSVGMLLFCVGHRILLLTQCSRASSGNGCKKRVKNSLLRNYIN